MAETGAVAHLMAALRTVAAPGGGDIVSAGLVESLSVKDGQAQLTLRARRETAHAMEGVAAEAKAVLSRQPEVARAAVVLTAHRGVPDPLAPPPGVVRGHGEDPQGPKFLSGAAHVIAVASGKGGVGKSTVAVNLAASLAGMGLRTGLIDADIHGPSLGRMLGITGRPEVRGQVLVPVERFGVRAMSMAFLVPERQAMIWRGPMVMGALQQMLGQTEWGELDVMVVDLPPGTGDAQLTLCQRVRLAGAVIVSTPQDIALIDARRGIAMFEKLGVRVLGVVENMSYFHCPKCGEETPVFGHGGAREEASRLDVPFLGEVPLLLEVRAAGDAGAPIVVASPGSAGAAALRNIADKVRAGIGL